MNMTGVGGVEGLVRLIIKDPLLYMHILYKILFYINFIDNTFINCVLHVHGMTMQTHTLYMYMYMYTLLLAQGIHVQCNMYMCIAYPISSSVLPVL